MQPFLSLNELLGSRLAGGRPYLEFLRVPSMSCGVYVLAVGAIDGQTPHGEDEIYFIASGTARMTLHDTNGESIDREITAGDLIFVAARQKHRFHSITQELVALVIFAPAET